MRRTTIFIIYAAISISALASLANADTFGSGANAFDIQFVTIGNPGNLPDENPNPAGAVPYSYRIGKYEVSEQMINKANTLGGLGLTIDSRGPDFPATSVTWYEAAKFVNWLNTSTGYSPPYKFDIAGNFQLWQPTDLGYDASNLYRSTLAKYFLPSLNEWHKSAYYDPVAGHYWDYPTGSDAVPDGIDSVGDPLFDAVFFDGGGIEGQPNNIVNVGLFSPFGTAGQGGNIREFLDTAFDRVNDVANEHRGTAGGSMNDTSNVLAAFNTPGGTAPLAESPIIGFRVAAIVPEPDASSIFASALLWLLGLRYRQ